jgi:hypothetical protein
MFHGMFFCFSLSSLSLKSSFYLHFITIVSSSPSTTGEQPIHNNVSEDTAQREVIGDYEDLDFYDEDREDCASEPAYVEPAGGEEVVEEGAETVIVGYPSSPAQLDLEESHADLNGSVSVPLLVPVKACNLTCGMSSCQILLFFILLLTLFRSVRDDHGRHCSVYP